MFTLLKYVRSFVLFYIMGAVALVAGSAISTYGHAHMNDLIGFYVRIELLAPVYEEAFKMLFAYVGVRIMRHYGVQVSWKYALIMTAVGFALNENLAYMYNNALLPAWTPMGQWFNPIYIGFLRNATTVVMHITAAYLNSIIPMFGYVWHLTFNALVNSEGVMIWQIIAFTYLPWAGHIIHYVASRIQPSRMAPMGKVVFAVTTIMLVSMVLVASLPTATPVAASCTAQPDGSFSCNNGAFVCVGVNEDYESFTNAWSDGTCVYR